ncbi:MAG: hypothetical protein E7471_04945 [Ruminococcaceae bacterium]|nr:hypothetical protein [Oscillospiraceae bacterium]
MELNLRKVTKTIAEKIWIIVFATVIAAILSFFVTKFLITPQYVSTATLYVQNTENRQIDVGINMVDLTAAIKLVDTYIVVMESDLVMDEVAQNIGSQYTGEEIREMFSAASEKETEVLRINVKNEDPVVANQIAEEILRVAPDELIRVVKAGAVEVIDHASYPTVPSSPNMKWNLFLGTLLGLLLSLIAVVLAEFLKVQIRDEEDLTDIFNIVVIGSVPEVEGTNINAKEKA